MACALIDRRLWIGRSLPHHVMINQARDHRRAPNCRRYQALHLCHITSIVSERSLWLLFGAIRSRNRGKPYLHRTRRPTLVTLPVNPSSDSVLNHQASLPDHFPGSPVTSTTCAGHGLPPQPWLSPRESSRRRSASWLNRMPPLPLAACPGMPNQRVRSVPGISAIPHDDNLRYFDVEIHGPSQSPYEGLHSRP